MSSSGKSRKAEVFQERLQPPFLVGAEATEIGQHLILEILIAGVTGAPPLGGHVVPGPQEPHAAVQLRRQVGLLPGDVVFVEV